MMSEKEVEELGYGFEFVLDELLTLITSFDISSNKLFEYIITHQKEAKNACCIFSVKQLKTDSDRLEMELVLPEADVDGLRFNEQKVQACFEKQNDGRNVKDDNRRDTS
jgi:hypothetical protein